MRDRVNTMTGNRQIKADEFGLYLSAWATEPATLLCMNETKVEFTHYFPADMDLAPHVAFCLGSLPPPLYADWCEERRVNMPLPYLNLLRGW